MRPFLDPATPPKGRPLTSPVAIPDDIVAFGKVPDLDLLKPGDIFLFSPVTPDKFSAQIIAAQKRRRDNESARWAHAAIYVDAARIVEANWDSVIANGGRYLPIWSFLRDNRIRVRRMPDLPNEAYYWRIAINAMARLPAGYDLQEALRIGLAGYLPKKYVQPLMALGKFWPFSIALERFIAWQTRRSKQPSAERRMTICSQLVVDAYNGAKAPIFPRPFTDRTGITPSDLDEADMLDDIPISWRPLK